MGVIERALIMLGMIAAGLTLGVIAALILDFIGRLGD